MVTRGYSTRVYCRRCVIATYYVDPGNANVTAWTADTEYQVGDYVRSTSLTAASAGYVFECTTSGGDHKSHAATEPEWVLTTPDTSTTDDDALVWTLRNPDSWGEALPGLQGAADRAVAGDTVYCKGTQTLTAAIDFDVNGGTYNGGYIKFVGVKAATTNVPPEATDYGETDYFTVDGNGGAFHGLYITDKDMLWFENIKITNCGNSTSYHGLTSSTASVSHLVLNHCWFHDNAGAGVSGVYIRAQANQCKATDNGGDGIYLNGTITCMMNCIATGNAGYGLKAFNAVTIINCISHNNTSGGIYLTAGGICVNCVVDGNASQSGISFAGNQADTIGGNCVIGCRVTNHNSDIGMEVTGNSRVLLLHNYLQNNSTPITASRYDSLPILGVTSHVTTSGSDSNESGGGLGGYVNASTDDFNLRATATHRSEALVIP